VNDTPINPMQELWQQQPVEGTHMSIDEIRRRASKFERRIFWRNIREYVAAGLSASLFVWFSVQNQNTLFRVACGLMIVGLAYVCYQLYRRASARSLPGDLGTTNALQFHRAELERQRDFVGHIWRWHLGPLVPGLATFGAMAMLDARAHHVHPWVAFFVNLFFVSVLVLAWKFNAYAARCLQKRIDELYTAEASE